MDGGSVVFYALAVTVNPANLGAIVDDVGNVDFSDSCTYEIAEGTALSLTATPSVDHKLDATNATSTASLPKSPSRSTAK
ncbi:MAG: hypothetical protein GY822_09200 [Deltaproteobacteria bacterium]|nr:hypothetical protein [Deltaproteobacteria bacterium]